VFADQSHQVQAIDRSIDRGFHMCESYLQAQKEQEVAQLLRKNKGKVKIKIN
jgi:hypothetical protein